LGVPGNGGGLLNEKKRQLEIGSVGTLASKRHGRGWEKGRGRRERMKKGLKRTWKREKRLRAYEW